MGFFSWRCAKTKRPVMSAYAVEGGPHEFSSRVIVLFRDGQRVHGIYDGYGRVGNVEIVDVPEQDWRMVIERYYEGETFDQLAENDYDQGQGFFYSDEDLERMFPEVTL